MIICCALFSLYVIHLFIPLNTYLIAAVCMIFIMPPVYMLTVYVKDKNENNFITTTTSIYTLLTLVAFFLLSVLIH